LPQSIAVVGAFKEVSPSQYAEDDSDPLVQAVCRLGDSSDRQEAMRRLKEDGRLGELRPHLVGLGDQVLDELFREVEREVVKLGERMGQAEQEISMIKEILNQRLKALDAEMAVLSPYLVVWWRKWLDDLEDTVAGKQFIQGLVQWFMDEGHQDQLKKYDAKLLKDGFAELLGTTDSTCLFIEEVVLHLVDEDRNNLVSRQELLGLQAMAREWAVQKCSEAPPGSILEVRMICILRVCSASRYTIDKCSRPLVAADQRDLQEL
jgi:hypothetical protein